MVSTKGEASRSRLIASAEELFARKGIHATTVSQIVAHAGLTQAAFYLYFKSKEEMVTELLDTFERRLDLFTDAGRHVGELPGGEIEDHVIRTFAGLFRLLGDNTNLTRIALQGTDRGELLRDRIVSRIADNMANNQSLAIVRPEVEPTLVAESVVASVERLVYRYIMTGEKDAEQLGRQAGKLFLRGILNHHRIGG
ncbi:TetR/AcrR family transcriptional regulator [Paenibacillus hemerocallicola]|uniref:TetR/AcrR family transcriptional regulator n=1 Tax=Paenibacillus hemerocallicola TaxID=1172614 RepID=A0A5C4T825_9BACL|nr:TetR/AcrR family transcriptional regulator [Paenibacillus hemerocallicola]TNJ64469.1 TetR/AcrR family transcriptional regulator [Paenibacillus hemerocallicola]